MKTRIIRTGNSLGIRIPKTHRGQFRAGDEVEVKESCVIIQFKRHQRQGWDEQFRKMAERGDDRLLWE